MRLKPAMDCPLSATFSVVPQHALCPEITCDEHYPAMPKKKRPRRNRGASLMNREQRAFALHDTLDCLQAGSSP